MKQYLWCFAPNCKYGAANGPVKVLKSDAKKLLRWKLKSNPDCGKVCQKCYNEDLCARKAAEERLAASATRANAAALKDAGGSVQQQKPQRSREATNDSSARESVDSRPTKKSKGGNNGQDDDRMMISKVEEDEDEDEEDNDDEEEEEEEEEQRQNEDAVGMVLPNRKEARDSKKRKPTRGQEMETPGEAIELFCDRHSRSSVTKGSWACPGERPAPRRLLCEASAKSARRTPAAQKSACPAASRER